VFDLLGLVAILSCLPEVLVMHQRKLGEPLSRQLEVEPGHRAAWQQDSRSCECFDFCPWSFDCEMRSIK
jgi:hypothetical protein